MGKKRTSGGVAAQPRIDKRVDRAWRALSLPDGRQYAGWYSDAVRRVGEGAADEFTERHAADADQLAGWVTQDFEFARVLYGGWYGNAILAQSRWIADQLAPLVTGDPQPLLVDAGGGLGFSAAVLSSALRARVISVDPLPGSADIASRLASLTGGDVEAHEVGVERLAEVLAGRRPTALYLVGALRYLQPHQHADDRTFTFAGPIRRSLASAVAEPAATALLTAATGAPIFATEVTCPDWIGEVEAVARPHGYHIKPISPGVLTIELFGDRASVATLHLSTGAPVPRVDDLLAAAAAHPSPDITGGLTLADAAAELGRRRLGIGTIRDGAELQYRDGTSRLELGTSGTLAWVYTSSTLNYRSLEVFDHESAARQRYQTLLEQASGGATIEPLTRSALLWE